MSSKVEEFKHFWSIAQINGECGKEAKECVGTGGYDRKSISKNKRKCVQDGERLQACRVVWFRDFGTDEKTRSRDWGYRDGKS